MENCCPTEKNKKKKKPILEVMFVFLFLCSAFWLFMGETGLSKVDIWNSAIYEVSLLMLPGITLGVFFVGLLQYFPQEVILKTFGNSSGLSGVLRATFLGVFLDLCSHGILLVAGKIYDKGVSLGQTVAFLVASPWNSFSLTLILISLVGFKWTLIFIACSMGVGILTGIVLNFFVEFGILPQNERRAREDQKPISLKESFELVKKEAKRKGFNLLNIVKEGFLESKAILKWVLIGIFLVGAGRVLIDGPSFTEFFGTSIKGMGLTLLTASIIEVCSEGLVPIAGDIFNRAMAPGNAFLFLMAGVCTDYTELLVLKGMTKSWKTPLVFVLVTVPQILAIAYVMNQF